MTTSSARCQPHHLRKSQRLACALKTTAGFLICLEANSSVCIFPMSRCSTLCEPQSKLLLLPHQIPVCGRHPHEQKIHHVTSRVTLATAFDCEDKSTLTCSSTYPQFFARSPQNTLAHLLLLHHQQNRAAVCNFYLVSNELPNYHNPTFLGFGTRLRHRQSASFHTIQKHVVQDMYAMLHASYKLVIFLKKKCSNKSTNTHNDEKTPKTHQTEQNYKKNVCDVLLHVFHEGKRKEVGKQKTPSCKKVGVSCLASCVWTNMAEKRSCLNANQLFLQRERGPRSLARDVSCPSRVYFEIPSQCHATHEKSLTMKHTVWMSVLPCTIIGLACEICTARFSWLSRCSCAHSVCFQLVTYVSHVQCAVIVFSQALPLAMWSVFLKPLTVDSLVPVPRPTITSEETVNVPEPQIHEQVVVTRDHVRTLTSFFHNLYDVSECVLGDMLFTCADTIFLASLRVYFKIPS